MRLYNGNGKMLPSVLGARAIGKKIASGEVKNILLLGDSITDGYGGTGYNGSQSAQISTNTAGYCWANALKKYLEATYSATVDNYGAYGSSLNNQRTLFKDVVESGTYDLIIFLTGTNNRTSEDSFTYYKSNLADVIEWMKGYSEVFVVNGIPGRADGEAMQPYGMDEIASVVVGVSDIPDYYDNLYIRFVEYCEAHDLVLTSDSTLFADYTHPNDAGYHVMFKLICSAMGITLSAHTDYSASGAWWAGTE